MERLRADYCVVGAGFAGLAAARRLRDRGKSVALVEARDRVGGRVWNRRAGDGSVVSVGGTWLGKRQDRMFELCRELGVDVYPQYDQGDTVMHLDGANRRYRGLPKVGLFALIGLGLAFWRLDRMVKRLPVAEPWKASGARRLDARTLGAWFGSPWNVPSATARKLIDTTMTTLFCVDPNEVSLLGSLVLARGGGSFEYYVDPSTTETHLVDGGAPEIAMRLAATLGDALHLSSPVRRIRQTGAGVEVFSDRVTVDARRVIVAAPPFLAGRIDYDPALPEAHAQLLRRMVSGSAIRGVTIYDEPFWRGDGLSGMSVAPGLPVPVALDQSPRAGHPGILSSYMFGPQAIEAAGLEPAQRRDIWLRALAARYGARALSPRAHLETDWAAEQWSLGGMIAHFAPGVLTNFGHALRAPAGRIHWAGAERATEMHGLMEGAVRSGERAADEVVALAAWTVAAGLTAVTPSVAPPPDARVCGTPRLPWASPPVLGADLKCPQSRRPLSEQGAEQLARQRAIVVDPGNRRQLRQARCIRQHFRKRHSARKPREENLVHSAVEPAVDGGGWHVVLEQPRVFELVGALFLQRPPRDFRIHDEGGAFAGGIEHERIRRIRGRLRIEYIAAVTHIHLGFEMRRLEVIVADLEHLPEGQLRMSSMPRQIRRRQAERIGLDLE